MHTKYTDLFDSLVKSYYSGDFDKTFTHIMAGHDTSPQETFSVICSLCGVSIPYDNNYIYNLKKAITHYSVNKKIIEKIDSCSSSCSKDINDKYACQAICPFDAIFFDFNTQSTTIDNTKCLHCGLCIDVCKSGRILDKVEFIPVIDLIKNNKVVIAAVAPAIEKQFGKDVSIDQLRAAFIKLGFTDMIEVAFAADILTINEAVEFNKHVSSPKDLMITSCCCPMWVGMLKKVYGELIPNISPSVSPMIAAGRIIKKLNPSAKVVFIGPCIAKKAEAADKDISDAIDFVLTFQEVDEIFKALEISPCELKPIPTKDYASRCGRLYARAGGVSEAIGEIISELYPEKYNIFKSIKAEGIKECKEILTSALNGNIEGNFIEGMGCIGGCVGGPKVLIPKEDGKVAVDDFAYDSAIKIPTHSEELDRILNLLDINSLIDFEDNSKIDILHRNF